MWNLLTCFTLFHQFTTLIDAVYFDVQLKPQGTKCYAEDLPSNALFVAEAQPRTQGAGDFRMTVFAKDPEEVFFNETSNGIIKAAFTVPRKGKWDVCLSRIQPTTSAPTVISLRLLAGGLAKDYSQIAKKEHFDPVVVELQAVEALIKDYRSKQMLLVGKEAKTKELVESTNSRVVTLAAVNVAVLILCNIVMILYLKAFFRAKKII